MPGTDGLPSGVSLHVGALGGTVIVRDGVTLGWIYAHGDRWNAYRRVGVGAQAIPLGTFARDDAVRAIVDAASSSPGVT